MTVLGMSFPSSSLPNSHNSPRNQKYNQYNPISYSKIHKLTPNDKKLVFKIFDEYKRKEKLTIILITHDLEDTLKADRIIVLDKGNIVLDGTCEEIYKDDTLEKMGFNLPFIVKLSHNLMLYDVLDKVYFDDVEVMKKLWG